VVKGLALIVLSAIAVVACVSAPEPPVAAQPSVLCQVISDPAAFDGREVTVRGIFASDYQHYSSLIDPACPRGLPPYSDGSPPGKAEFDAVLCSESGGLVEVSARGRVEARPGEIPSVRFHVQEYTEPRAVTFDPNWIDRYGVLRSEADMRWDNRRMLMCFIAGYVDPDTRERREPPQ
jgi:hypothetical protein